MDIHSIQLEDFMQCVVKVNKRLENMDTCHSLLEEARQDTPIIAGILEQMKQLEAHPDSEMKRRGHLAAHRDMTVFLALRELQAQQSG
jgi:hypothetical protein